MGWYCNRRTTLKCWLLGGNYRPVHWSVSSGEPSSAKWMVVAVIAGLAVCPAALADSESLLRFRKGVEPILSQSCTTCHNSTAKKGGIALDPDDPGPMVRDQDLWLKVLKMVQSGLMPPRGKRRPSAEEVARLVSWIKYSALGIDAQNPDPGRVTLRRLNRVEYRNTIRDLVGVDFDATGEFPADDTGHGFDTIADVLTVSPLLLEKYVAAAKAIIAQAVPVQPLVPAERRIAGQRFVPANGDPASAGDGPLTLSYYQPVTVTHELTVERAGHYQLVLDLTASDTYVDGRFDYNKCRLDFKCGNKTLLTQEFSRQGGKPYRFEFEQDWPAGKQPLTLAIEPLAPKVEQVRSLKLRVNHITVRGPMAREYWVHPARYENFFPGTVPEDSKGRLEYVRRVIEQFASRAYRRPVDGATLDRLVALAGVTAAKPGKTFEAGIAQAMLVILASPRFLFREEKVEPSATDLHPLLDEYSLASRLSYFLWSSMPDEELFRLAGQHKLRANLDAQVTRMLSDKRSGELVRNFTGQWLQTRNIETAIVNAAAVLSKDEPLDPAAQKKRERFRQLFRKPPEQLTNAEKKELEEARRAFFRGFRRFSQFELTGELRRAMRQETEMTFEYLLKNDRSLLESIDSDYTFLNERLARYYGIDGVKGDAMRRVSLPANSLRGGILTQGTFLVVTSNPDRTSPVKRGLYILDSLLGTPPPPPPPNIASLEQVVAGLKGKPPTLREALKIHRNEPLCSSCHNRMDPLGLAFENFNALGRWRDKERGQPIESSGQLLTGESFKDVRELKHVLATSQRFNFYRCVTEKMLIYALGRGLGPQDVHTVDLMVDKLEAAKGRPSVLIRGIIDSPAFQRRGKFPGSGVVSLGSPSNTQSE
jgi:hypothetical protein